MNALRGLPVFLAICLLAAMPLLYRPAAWPALGLLAALWFATPTRTRRSRVEAASGSGPGPATLESESGASSQTASRSEDSAGPETTRCCKCGNDDLAVRWHRERLACQRFADLVARDPIEEREHLHYYCKRCQYNWTGDIVGGAA